MVLYIWQFCTWIKLSLILIVVVIVLSPVSIFFVQAHPGISSGSPEYAGWLEDVNRTYFGLWTDTLAFGVWCQSHYLPVLFYGQPATRVGCHHVTGIFISPPPASGAGEFIPANTTFTRK